MLLSVTAYRYHIPNLETPAYETRKILSPASFSACCVKPFKLKRDRLRIIWVFPGFWIGAEKDRRTRFSVLSAPKMERERKNERFAPFFTRSLTLAPCSLLRNRKRKRLLRRLDYQPLFGKMSPHSSPSLRGGSRPDPGDGGNRAYLLRRLKTGLLKV